MSTQALNSQQLSVVKCSHSRVLCLAGAGTGKTFTMLEKIKHEIAGGINPSSILVLTFTNAAASEMKHRFLSNADDKSNCPEFRTFHSFCYSLIVQDIKVRSKLRYSKVPNIAEEFQVSKKMKECEEQLGIKYPKSKSGRSLTIKEEQEVKRLNKLLDDKMRASGLITFDTLCYEVCELFESEDECILPYKSKYKYIFVDEFQDTDIRQWKFVKSFTDSKICVVGDALQSIYGFRGGTSAIIKDLSNDPDWTVFKLSRNYRSKFEICEYANKHSAYADDSYRVAISSDVSGGEVHESDIKYTRGIVDDKRFISFCANSNNWEGTTAILFRTNREVSMACDQLSDKGCVYYTKSSKSADPINILKSVKSDGYFIDWLASLLKSEDHTKYIHHIYEVKSDGNNYTPSDFIHDWQLPELIVKFNSVARIRKLYKSENTDLITCWYETWKLINIDAPHMPEGLSTKQDVLSSCIDAIENMGDPESDVYIGTIHSVKGLEFDNVVVAGPGGPTFPLTDEESRNLYYVAVTRAKNNLYVFRGVTHA